MTDAPVMHPAEHIAAYLNARPVDDEEATRIAQYVYGFRAFGAGKPFDATQSERWQAGWKEAESLPPVVVPAVALRLEKE